MIPRSVLAVAALGCGERAAPAPPAPPAEVALRAEPAGRAVVATVDGEPVYDDCVARQAAAHGIGARAALEQCIDFELLAQEAARRGLAADPEALHVRTTEMVRALVMTDYGTTMDEPSDIPAADLRALWDQKIQHLYNKPERRRATYCRVPIAEKRRGTPADGEARALAARVHRAMGRSIDAERFAATCASASGGRAELPPKPLKPFASDGRYAGGRNVPEFTAAAFSVPAGRPADPIRTRWGWDIVLWDAVVPEVHATPAEIAEQALPEIKRAYFPQWVNLVAKSLGAKIQVVDKNIPLLEEL